jgi:hypothetical protein
MIRLTSACALLVLLPAASVLSEEAAEPRFRPATFGTGEASIVNVVNCPVKDADEALIWVFCQGQVRDTGEVRQGYCVADGPHPEFRAAALDALRRSRFEPAQVDGAPVHVYMSFRLAFQLQGEHCSVTAIPNKGFHGGEYGLAYIEPQEIVADRGWHARRMNAPGTRSRRSGTMFTLSALVDASGTPSDGKVEHLNFGDRRTANGAARALGNSRFIPGFVDGQPASMRSFEFYYVDPDGIDVRDGAESSAPAGRGVP